MESFSKSKLVLHRLIPWYPLNRKTKNLERKSHSEEAAANGQKHNLHLVMSAFCWHSDEETKKRDLFADGGGCGSVARMHR